HLDEVGPGAHDDQQSGHASSGAGGDDVLGAGGVAHLPGRCTGDGAVPLGERPAHHTVGPDGDVVPDDNVAEDLGAGADVAVIAQAGHPLLPARPRTDHHPHVEAAVGPHADLGMDHDGAAVGDGQAGAEDVERDLEPAAHALPVEAPRPVLVEQPADGTAAAVHVVLRVAQQPLEAPDLI